MIECFGHCVGLHNLKTSLLLTGKCLFIILYKYFVIVRAMCFLSVYQFATWSGSLTDKVFFYQCITLLLGQEV